MMDNEKFCKSMKQQVFEQSFEFMKRFNQLQQLVHQIAVHKGFWPDDGNRNQGEMIALMHAELSEGLEAIRGGLMSDHIENYSGIEEELADCIIRIMDFADGYDLDVCGAMVEKIKFNLAWPFKHGKRF